GGARELRPGQDAAWSPSRRQARSAESSCQPLCFTCIIGTAPARLPAARIIPCTAALEPASSPSMDGRRRNLFWLAAGTLIVAIGGLVAANLLAFDPRDVKKELERDLAEYKLIPEADVLKRDVFLHGLLANESYREHAKALYRDVERADARVHGAANLEL